MGDKQAGKGREITFWEKPYDPKDKVKIPKAYECVLSGDHYLTRTIKRLCAEAGLDYYVQMRKGRRYSRAVAYYAPNPIVKEAKRLRDMTSEQRAKQRAQATVYRANKEIEYQEQFAVRIHELFPRIAMEEARLIAHRACEVGSERVGRTRQIDLDQKVELAVGAYARHEHTNYEEELKDAASDYDYEDIRQQYSKTVKRILDEWRKPPSENESESN